MTAQHTPTPWRINVLKGASGCLYGYEKDGALSCLGTLHTQGSHNAQANAAFIVKAVNCYDQLVEALKALHQLSDNMPLGSVSAADAWKVNEQVNAALAAAEAQ